MLPMSRGHSKFMFAPSRTRVGRPSRRAIWGASAGVAITGLTWVLGSSGVWGAGFNSAGAFSRRPLSRNLAFTGSGSCTWISTAPSAVISIATSRSRRLRFRPDLGSGGATGSTSASGEGVGVVFWGVRQRGIGRSSPMSPIRKSGWTTSIGASGIAPLRDLRPRRSSWAPTAGGSAVGASGLADPRRPSFAGADSWEVAGWGSGAGSRRFDRRWSLAGAGSGVSTVPAASAGVVGWSASAAGRLVRERRDVVTGWLSGSTTGTVAMASGSVFLGRRAVRRGLDSACGAFSAGAGVVVVDESGSGFFLRGIGVQK